MTVDISNELNIIKSTQLGRTMRPALHASIKKQNKELNRASTLIDEFIKNAQQVAPQNAEIVAARIDNNSNMPVVYDTLGKRLDKLKEDIEKKANQREVSVEGIPDTIVKRGPNGVVQTSNYLSFFDTSTGQEYARIYADEDTENLRRYDNDTTHFHTIWDNGNLPIEKGTFTPYGYGGDNAEQFIHTSQRGTYYKIGKLVTVQGRIIASGFKNARGHFRIGGLPFRVREQYPPCIIGFMAGIKTLNANSQITAYGENAYQFIQFVVNDLNAGGGWSNITVDKLIAPLDVSFNMTYLVD